MGVKIYIPAADVWSFFENNKKRLSEEMVIIAENTEIEYAVYLTEENGYPLFVVCQGSNDAEYNEGAISQKDCEDTAQRCFLRYLYPVTVTSTKNRISSDNDLDDECIKQEMEETMYEREDELTMAMDDFLQVALCGDSAGGSDLVGTYDPELINDVLEHTLQYIAESYKLPVYRPTFIVNDLGEDEYIEYPYNVEKPKDLSDSLSYK